MPKYLVTVAVSGTEYYVIDAENEDEAWNNWYDGEQRNVFEGDDYEAVEVEELNE